MAIGALIPLVLFIVILGSVGIRLVRLWRRTRKIPELCLGAGLLAVSFSIPFSAIGRVPALALEPAGRLFFATGLCATACGISAMVFFTYRVFRCDALWGRALFMAISALLLGSAIYMIVMNFRGESLDAIKRAMLPGTMTLMGTLLLSFLWSAIESFRCFASARRQLRVGLGDAVIANRFALWGVGAVASAALLGVVIACVQAGMTIMREPAPLAAMAGAGAIMSATWYLTFFAPESYQRFVRERASYCPDGK